MLSYERNTLEEASRELRRFALAPQNWVSYEGTAEECHGLPQSPAYERQVGKLRINAAVGIRDNLDTFVRISFRSPGLTPMKAVDHLEEFVRDWLPLMPNTEWRVHSDDAGWIHFMRRYASDFLKG